MADKELTPASKTTLANIMLKVYNAGAGVSQLGVQAITCIEYLAELDEKDQKGGDV